FGSSNPGGVSSPVPVKVTGLASGVTAIAVGAYEVCAVVNGGASCDGYAPPEMSSGATAVALGTDGSPTRQHACAIKNGDLRCWGDNTYGQLGNDTEGDVLGMTSGVTAVAAGQSFTCAVARGGAWCWGQNGSGNLGNDSGTTLCTVVGLAPLQCRDQPLEVVGLTKSVTDIATGTCHACAIVGGGVQCWGNNGDGQLGNNSTSDSHTPVQVHGMTTGATAVAGGDSHTCAVVEGRAWCWGSNSHGELGNNSSKGSDVPVPVSGL
ncbi:MAG TPA: hypothetical protein VMK12_18100, partial [Anaeromyxobacteraceae bacterium]|nr:hypothetical protein [Anaeromyxobacteraceae bacterium]